MFDGMTNKLVVSRFLTVFMSYFPRFGGFRAIYNERNTRYMFKGMTKKLVVFAFYGRLHELLSTVWGL